MRRMLLLLIFLAAWIPSGSLAQAGGPHYAFRDLPIGLVLGDPGALSMSLHLSPEGWGGAITGSVAERIDVSFHVTPGNLFEPELRLQVVRDLLPLQVAIALRPTDATFATTLLLGPVDLSLGRSWEPSWMAAGSGGGRWLFAQWAASQSLAILVGIDVVDRVGDPHDDWGPILGLRLSSAGDPHDDWGPILGLRLSSTENGLLGSSILFSGGVLRLTIGGTL